MTVGGHRTVIHYDLSILFLSANDVISIPVLKGSRCIVETFLESSLDKKKHLHNGRCYSFHSTTGRVIPDNKFRSKVGSPLGLAIGSYRRHSNRMDSHRAMQCTGRWWGPKWYLRRKDL